MRARIRRWLGIEQDAKGSTAANDALASSHAALAQRMDEFLKLHEDLVRQVGIQASSSAEQFTKIRAIVTQRDSDQRSQAPLVARSMADIRRFTEGDELN